MLNLRYYQQAAVDAAIANTNGILVLSTGSGKSLCVAGIVNRVDGRVLVLQPTKEILESNYDKIVASGFEGATIYSASMGIKEIGKCTYATIGSIINKLELFAGTATLVIDECHLVNAKGGMYEKLIKALQPKRLIGLTATPYRLHTTSFGSDVRILSRTRPKLFDKIIYVAQTAELAKQGFLMPPKYIVSGEDTQDILKPNSTGAEFTEESVESYLKYTDIVGRVVDAAKEAQVKHILVFMPSLAQSAATVVALRQAGISADSVSGESGKAEREEKLAAFRSGEIKAMINVGVLCLDDKTEILTRQGWVGIDTMTYNHDVACWSMDGSIKFKPPKFIVRRDRFEGETMVSSKGDAIDFRVTGDHRIVYGLSDHKWREKKAIELVGKRFRFPVSGNAIQDSLSPDNPVYSAKRIRRLEIVNAYNYRKIGLSKEKSKEMARVHEARRKARRFTSPQDLSLDDCRFIGFWLGDGTIVKAKNGGQRCEISQSMRYESIIKWFDGVIGRVGLHHSRHTSSPNGNQMFDVVRWSFARGTGGSNQFIENGYYRLECYLNKEGTDLFWGLSETQFSALLEGFWYADGEHGTNKEYEKTSKSWTVAGTQKKLYDLLQAIGTCRGFRFIMRPVKINNPKHSPQWKIRWQKRYDTHIAWAKPQVEKEWKAERVWCVTSETSFIITRRNGCVMITGNTTGYDFPALDCVICARPTKSLSLNYQMIGRCVRPSPNKQQPIVYDLVDNYSRFDDPMNYWLVESTPGLHAVLSKTGRLTNRIIGNGPECEDRVEFGKFKGTKLKDVPDSYLDWYLKDAKKSAVWHAFRFEQLRRELFNAA